MNTPFDWDIERAEAYLADYSTREYTTQAVKDMQAYVVKVRANRQFWVQGYEAGLVVPCSTCGCEHGP